MRNYFLIYDDCCFFEIVLLGYFMKYSTLGEQPCAYCMAGSADDAGGGTIRTSEGFCVQADTFLSIRTKSHPSSFRAAISLMSKETN